MIADDEACILHSCPHLALASDEGETNKEGLRDLGALSGAVGKAGEASIPHKRSMLSGIASDIDVNEGKVVCPIASEAASSREGQGTRWSDRHCMSLLQEIDFLRTSILLKITSLSCNASIEERIEIIMARRERFIEELNSCYVPSLFQKEFILLLFEFCFIVVLCLPPIKILCT